MVIDNVDDKDSFFRDTLPSGNTPSQCIPKCAHGSLLFTTRTRDIAFDLATPAEPIAIPRMTKQEGIQLVKERLRRGPDPLDDTTIGELLDELECIPLAITQAISFISKRRITIPQYLERYRQSDATRTRMLTFEFAEHGRQIGSLESVAKTWSVTFKWIRSNNPRAANLLCLISFFQNQAIPRQLLLTPKGQAREGLAAEEEETEEEEEEEEDGFDFEDALDTLCAFSLLDTGGSANVFTTHHLVQLATRWWLQNENPEEQSRWALAALQSVGRRFPAEESMATGYWSLCEALFPHAELVFAYDFGSQWLPGRQRTIDLARATLLVATGHYLAWMGAFDEALPRLEESVALRTRHLGERDVDTLASMGQVAWFHSLILPTPTRAIPLGRRVLALRAELLGVDHEKTIDSMCDLAGALEENGEYIESETLIREAIERGTRTIGPRSLLVLNCTAVLAEAIENQGRFTEAVELYRLVHKAKRDIYGPEDMRVLIIETYLASTLIERDETWEEGESLMRRTLAVKQRTLGPDHRETLVSAHNLIIALKKARRFQEALAICDASMAAWEQSPRKNNHHSAECVEKIRHLAQTIRR
jgi:tetratricopeptide (TPR) repeat protein